MSLVHPYLSFIVVNLMLIYSFENLETLLQMKQLPSLNNVY